MRERGTDAGSGHATEHARCTSSCEPRPCRLGGHPPPHRARPPRHRGDARRREAQPFADAGAAAVTTCDARNPDALRAVLQHGQCAFLLNPPADPSTDTDTEERASVAAILAALDGSGLERVVALSTYGARAGDALGNLSVLHDLETGLRAQPIPAAVVRGANFMSNWDAALAQARDQGELHTFVPVDLALPMVAPDDLGRAGARLLTADWHEVDQLDIRHVEGPDRYTAGDVAAAFATALARPVEAVAIPRTRWEETFRAFGFSATSAHSYTRMTAVTADQSYEMPAQPERGTTTLHAYVSQLVRRESQLTTAPMPASGVERHSTS